MSATSSVVAATVVAFDDPALGRLSVIDTADITHTHLNKEAFLGHFRIHGFGYAKAANRAL